MVLTKDEIEQLGLVEGAVANPRDTTYDATVGSIIVRGMEIEGESFSLPPRGVVWLVSNERFILPGHVTGLATLRTTWTHDGLLALNVGIVDPGWEGPLAAVVVNFGSTTVRIKKNQSFLRLIFHTHNSVKCTRKIKDREEYKKEIILRSRSFAESFLDLHSLSRDVEKNIWASINWTLYVSVFAVVIALIAIFVPISYSVYTDYYTGPLKIDMLQRQIDDLKKEIPSPNRLTQIEESVRKLQSEESQR